MSVQPEIGGISPFFIVRNVSAAFSFYRDSLGFDVTFQEPKQFMDDALQMYFLRGNKGKSFLQVKTHLVTKTALRTGSGSVGFVYAGI